VDLAVGTYHGCAVTQGAEVWCWGSNIEGQLGASVEDLSPPVPVRGLGGAVEVACGPWGSCAVDRGGSVWCWGAHPGGLVGTRGTEPVRLEQPAGVVRLTAGGDRNCAVNGVGVVHCWGPPAPPKAGGPEPRAEVVLARRSR
jgi:alpha-tubulin suppressor-like RCC1 family protein